MKCCGGGAVAVARCIDVESGSIFCVGNFCCFGKLFTPIQRIRNRNSIRTQFSVPMCIAVGISWQGLTLRKSYEWIDVDVSHKTDKTHFHVIDFLTGVAVAVVCRHCVEWSAIVNVSYYFRSLKFGFSLRGVCAVCGDTPMKWFNKYARVTSSLADEFHSIDASIQNKTLNQYHR